MLGWLRCGLPSGASGTERPLVLSSSRPLNAQHPLHHPVIGLTTFQPQRNSSTTSPRVHVIVGEILVVQLPLMPGAGPRWRQPAPWPPLPTRPHGRRHPGGAGPPRSLLLPWTSSTSTTCPCSRGGVARRPVKEYHQYSGQFSIKFKFPQT